MKARSAGPARENARQGERLLRLLGEPGAVAEIVGDRLIIIALRRGVSLRIGNLSAEARLDLLSSGALASLGGSDTRFVLTEEGRKALARRSGDPGDFGRQHRLLEETRPDGPGRPPVLANAAESPLVWLARHKGRDGAPLIDAASFEAGERLRRDLTLAGSLPRMSLDWARLATGRDPNHAGLHMSEVMIAARQRTERAFAAIGPDFSGLLLDICGFLKSIETVESERGWPARSAKVVLGLALRALARHYGLQNEARGPAASRGIRSWHEADTGRGQARRR